MNVILVGDGCCWAGFGQACGAQCVASESIGDAVWIILTFPLQGCNIRSGAGGWGGEAEVRLGREGETCSGGVYHNARRLSNNGVTNWWDDCKARCTGFAWPSDAYERHHGPLQRYHRHCCLGSLGTFLWFSPWPILGLNAMLFESVPRPWDPPPGTPPPWPSPQSQDLKSRDPKSRDPRSWDPESRDPGTPWRRIDRDLGTP